MVIPVLAHVLAVTRPWLLTTSAICLQLNLSIADTIGNQHFVPNSGALGIFPVGMVLWELSIIRSSRVSMFNYWSECKDSQDFSELSVISWVSAVEGCSLSRVSLYVVGAVVTWHCKNTENRHTSFSSKFYISYNYLITFKVGISGMAISEPWVWINWQLQSLHNFQQKFGSNCAPSA